MGLRRNVGPYSFLTAPELGRVRDAGRQLRARRRGVDALFVQMAHLEHEPVAEVGRAMAAALADALVDTVATGADRDLSAHRDRLAGFVRAGWSAATAEERTGRMLGGLTEPHVATVLAFLALRNRADDELVKDVCDWALEAGYYLTRTGEPDGPLLAGLRRALTARFAPPAGAGADIPRQTQRARTALFPMTQPVAPCAGPRPAGARG